jgi:hypothetical protein
MNEEVGMVDAALQSASSWLERWAVHAGNCTGGAGCTCGLTAIRWELQMALSSVYEEGSE